MHARIGDRIEPMTELLVQVVEVAENAAEEGVLADNTGNGRSTLPFVLAR